jgi:pyruvate/2-oxoglutarate dehydrogenase complex dihydrolipoamide dehydrogenase (E3) component
MTPSTPPHAPPSDADPRADALARWREALHPADWHNPEPRGRYNLVVLGGGPAGLVYAAAAAGMGARVALVERHLLGGDCLNVGCVPSKGLVRAGRAAAAVRRAAQFGVQGVDGGVPKADFARVMARIYGVRADLSPHDGARRYAGLGVDVFLGEGRFLGPDRIGVGDRVLAFRRAVIATGARAAVPPIPGLAEAGPLTNETVFDLKALPARLAVIGAGPIGLELGQAFARLGARVTVIEQTDRILPREEAKAAAILQGALAEDGVRVLTGASVRAAEVRGGTTVLQVACGGDVQAVEVDAVLVGAGRMPNVEALDLEAAGVRYAPGTGVAVDDRLRTSNPRVYAAGDVCFPHKFTHAADACARIVIANALFPGRQKASALVVPWCTYTDPEVAHVGLTEAEAAARGDVDVVEVENRTNDRSRLDGDDTGYARVYLKRGTDRILGATMVSSHAGDLIAEIALAMTHRMGLLKVRTTVHPYPTTSEMWKKAADAYYRTLFTPRLQKWVRRWLDFTR